MLDKLQKQETGIPTVAPCLESLPYRQMVSLSISFTGKDFYMNWLSERCIRYSDSWYDLFCHHS